MRKRIRLHVVPASLLVLSASVPLAAARSAPFQAEVPTATVLTDQARKLMPTYDGETRTSLTPEEQPKVRAAAHLLAAAVELEPENTYSLWWLGHARMLLGEDRRSRGDAEDATSHHRAALAALDRALELDDSGYWTHYARAMARAALGDNAGALDGYGDTIDRANAALEAGDEAAAFVRFKARQWRCEVLMRALDFEAAREEWRSFYADNGNNQWDLGYSLAESYLRERDYANARRTYEAILETPEFVPYSSTHEQLGYLAGLQGDTAGVVARLEEALAHEFEPSMYTRLWLWILAPEAERERYGTDLEELLDHPPPNVTEWDAQLGRFAYGQGWDEEFVASAREELVRRLDAGEAPGDLMAEVWFYVGLRHERQARRAAEDFRIEELKRALDAYRRTLAEDPGSFKWEWEYARNGFARVAAALQTASAPGFALDGGSFTASDGAPLIHALARSRGTVTRLRHHPVGADEPRTLDLAGPLPALPPGDLLLVSLRDEANRRAAVRLVVDAR